MMRFCVSTILLGFIGLCLFPGCRLCPKCNVAVPQEDREHYDVPNNSFVVIGKVASIDENKYGNLSLLTLKNSSRVFIGDSNLAHSCKVGDVVMVKYQDPDPDPRDLTTQISEFKNLTNNLEQYPLILTMPD